MVRFELDCPAVGGDGVVEPFLLARPPPQVIVSGRERRALLDRLMEAVDGQRQLVGLPVAHPKSLSTSGSFGFAPNAF